MKQITHILCAIDFSDESRHALDHAIVLAKWYDAAITGVYVYGPLVPAIPDASGLAYPGFPVFTEGDKKDLEQQLESFLREAQAVGVSRNVRVVSGRPADGILDAAKATGTDMIVMGTHGVGGFQRLIIGSVAERVLRRAACPVMTVPPRAQSTSVVPYKRIVCPVDFGEQAKAALELAASIASEGDAELIVMHVVEAGAEFDPLAARSFTVPEYHNAARDAASEALTQLLNDDMREWCRPVTRIAAGKPYQEILRVAADDKADLIVMGVHGRNPIDLAFFGSTTNHVVRAATCPVMTLRA